MKRAAKSSITGFSLIDLLMIVAALTAMAFVMMPRLFVRKAKCSMRVTCTYNLKMIGLAARQWSLDNGDKFPARVSTAKGGAKETVEAGAVYTAFLVMSNELNTARILICPEEKRKPLVKAQTFDLFSGGIPLTNNHNVTYFVGLDADEMQPSTILSGDDNFAVAGVKSKPGVLMLWTNSPIAWTKDRHINQGNFAFADGSVLGFITPVLKKALIDTGMATNRWAMP